MFTMKRAALSLALLGLLAGNVGADELTIPVMEQGAEKQAIDRPANGMTADAVRSKFGEPSSTEAAVGTPPINRWHYADYTVFFEGDRVIHTVLAK